MRRLVKHLTRLHDGVTWLSYIGGTIALGVIVVSYCYEVLVRYIFNSPTTWANELVSYSLCACVFLMMPHVTQKGGHVAVTFLIDLAPKELARFMIWVTFLMGFVVTGFSTWISLDENIRQIVKNVYLMKVNPIPKWWISVFITYGFGLSALHFLRLLDYRKIVVGEGLGGGNL